MLSLICRILKNYTNDIQNRNEPTDIKNKLMITKGERWRRDKFGIWD